MPYTGSPPTFSLGEKTGIAAKLNQFRDAIRGFTDPWTSYTPTLTASTTTPTGWTQTGRYLQVGKLVSLKFALAADGSMTAGSGTYRVALPAAANVSMANAIAGTIQLYDFSTGAVALAVAQIANASYLQIQLASAAGYATNNTPWTWTATDQIAGIVTYEAA